VRSKEQRHSRVRSVACAWLLLVAPVLAACSSDSKPAASAATGTGGSTPAAGSSAPPQAGTRSAAPITNGSAGSRASVPMGPTAGSTGGSAAMDAAEDAGQAPDAITADAATPADCSPVEWQNPGNVGSVTFSEIAADAGMNKRPFESIAALKDYDYEWKELTFTGASPPYTTITEDGRGRRHPSRSRGRSGRDRRRGSGPRRRGDWMAEGLEANTGVTARSDRERNGQRSWLGDRAVRRAKPTREVRHAEHSGPVHDGQELAGRIARRGPTLDPRAASRRARRARGAGPHGTGHALSRGERSHPRLSREGVSTPNARHASVTGRLDVTSIRYVLPSGSEPTRPRSGELGGSQVQNAHCGPMTGIGSQPNSTTTRVRRLVLNDVHASP